ncbi:cellulase family glycosylhydrolase [Microbispora sp. NEAU-D428]|uniref:cellulase family glycosylhydrolase n=1 Tax=Microbispora sitophila TaxID=2771537 RepID=UPI0018670BCC|nr:cellulase family glycosylhydrolase [Microbispora sitophila]MBE3011941.1 cellulase family glycosylhydrolase [Microbispora sitophila]
MKHRVAWAAAAAVGLVAVGAAVMTGPASAAGAGCSVKYKVVSEWQGGFQGDVAITNLGDPWSSWTLEFDFPTAGQGVNNGWSADWSQSGSHVTAKSLSWNGNVASNGSVSVGFVGKWSGGNPAPTAFKVNGVACDGSIPSPSPSPTRSPSPSPSPTRSPSPSPSPSPSTSPSPGPGGPAPQLHVSGNKIVTADGKPYRLLGVSRSSGEYACVQGKGTWDHGPVDQASVDAMKSWNIHAVRVPLNEECWLGTNGSPSGAAYQQDVKDYVNLLVANGITPILDLHWNWGQFTGVSWACTDTAATCQKPMPDAKYAPQFWTGVAKTFKGDNAVVFDLFNEPWPEYGTGDTTSGWKCLRDGGNCPGFSYEVAGMQSLVDAVRATGATNIVMVGGLAWSNDLSQWQQYKPSDPTGNLVASWHSYSFNYCSNEACWDSQIAPLAAKVPVVTGEFGADNCGYDYMDRLTKWADKNGVSYLAWTWSPWGCSTGAVLIKDYAGTPEPGIGEGYKAHLLTQNPYA